MKSIHINGNAGYCGDPLTCNSITSSIHFDSYNGCITNQCQFMLFDIFWILHDLCLYAYLLNKVCMEHVLQLGSQISSNHRVCEFIRCHMVTHSLIVNNILKQMIYNIKFVLAIDHLSSFCILLHINLVGDTAWWIGLPIPEVALSPVALCF